MARMDMRFGWVHLTARLMSVAITALGAGLLLLGMATAVVVLVRAQPVQWTLLSVAGGLVIAGLLATLAGLLIHGLFTLLLKLESHTFRLHDVMVDLLETESAQRDLMGAVADNVQLSDAAKVIAHREKERGALRSAIHEEIARHDWEAAYSLIDAMEHRYGYRQEAKRLRQEVDVSRDRSIEETVQAALEHIDRLFAAAEWEQARSESQRLMNLFPRNERIQRLPEDLERHRQQHKRRLLTEWNEAVQRNEIDRSIEVLKKLDQYLTPSEAAALEESARGVFRAKLQNLGVQFSLAVTEKRWKAALDIGEQIVSEFPNSLMAKEVTDGMPVLRKRAGITSSAPEPASS